MNIPAPIGSLSGGSQSASLPLQKVLAGVYWRLQALEQSSWQSVKSLRAEPSTDLLQFLAEVRNWRARIGRGLLSYNHKDGYHRATLYVWLQGKSFDSMEKLQAYCGLWRGGQYSRKIHHLLRRHYKFYCGFCTWRKLAKPSFQKWGRQYLKMVAFDLKLIRKEEKECQTKAKQ